MQETWVWSLGWEDPLKKEVATHSSVLACEIPWTEELGGLQSIELQKESHNWVTKQLLSGLCRLDEYPDRIFTQSVLQHEFQKHFTHTFFHGCDEFHFRNIKKKNSYLYTIKCMPM